MNCFQKQLSLNVLSACLLQAATAPSIAVFADFQSQPSAKSVSHMKQEVAAILKPSGLALDWRALSTRSNTESYADLVVVKFSGTCQVRIPSMDSELGPAIEHFPLATTAVTDGRVLPFSDVNCNEIRRFLAPELAQNTLVRQEAMYGKALGRVVAHELYHIFAGTEEHGKDGVARSFHTRRDLTEYKFRFSPQETNTLHEVKWRALLAGEAEAVSWHPPQR